MVNVMARTWAIGCLLALVVALAAGCGGHKAAEPPPSPLIARDAVAAGGAGVLGSYSTGLTADYTPNHNFGLAFVIQNRGEEPVTIVGLSSTDESEKRFARLIGASATAYVPIDCDGHSCPATDLGLGSPPFGPLPPFAAMTIPAHRQANLQLHFRWVPCLDAPTRANESENSTLVVNYRSGGKGASQLLDTGRARLDVSSSSACSAPASS
jgi:hypothetical protein